MPRHPLYAIIAAILVCQAVGSAASAETRLLRFPDIHDNQIVFTYAGDLWMAKTNGGLARRLTAHAGMELFAKFSPDGEWLAFTGQYDGDEQVYVMPAQGGVPRQLSFYPARGPLPDRWGYDSQVYGWTPDGKRILFRSLRDGWSLAGGRLYTVAVDGGLPEPLPMPQAGAGDFAEDGRRLVYSPLFRDFRTWKRYEGGWAQDLYIFDTKSHRQHRITEHVRTDRDPMWIGQRIYFASDRSGTLNLYEVDLASKEVRPLTKSKTFDVRWPSKGEDGQIVFEMGGVLSVLDTKTGVARPVKIEVPTDGLAMRPRRESVADMICGFGLSPQGERVLFTARGDLFTAPVEKGSTRNLTATSNAHDKAASWSPDGRNIAFLSDLDGEEELYLVDALGKQEPAPLTDGGTAMRYSPRWSPDGERIAFGDKAGKLFVVTVDDKKISEVADEKSGRVKDYDWSPCSGFLAFSLQSNNGNAALHIWSVAEDRLRKVTGDDFSEFSPTWGAGGKYLFYFSDRDFAPQLGSFEWNYVVDRETGIFALALQKDTPHPFPPESDEAEVTDATKTPEKKPAEGDTAQKNEDKDKPADQEKEFTKIHFSGLAQRSARLPIPADNYRGLSAVKDHLLYVRTGASYYGRASDIQPELFIFSLKTRKATSLAEKVAGYAVSASGNKILVRQAGSFVVMDATPQGKNAKKTVSTAGLVADIDPRQEWRQVFHEVWRRFRDFFYVENMHGYDWEALRDQYEPLLEHVGHRSDLSYVIGEMIAELNVGHAYNAGGDFVQPERPSVALPGARFALDRASQRYRIRKIFAGHNEEPNYRSPLTEIGVNVNEGDFVLAIDGQNLTAKENPYRLLWHKADRVVTLTVNSKPTAEGARELLFQPITSESDLIYLDWVLKNRRKVADATKGRVGYIHLPNMGSDGIREFNKWFYSQLRKDGLIIDVRGNGGGNVSQMLINRLRRTLLATGFSRNDERVRTYPRTLFHGHLVCLLDENSASDGDIFPAMFREAGLGPLIGKRSWGGVIGITNHGQLIDGGSVNVPEYGFASKEGKWILEGHGVDPDIIVENAPQSVIRGKDPQLERGIKEILDRIRKEPRRLPTRQVPPVKTPDRE
ncbi:MAG: S41 family peptidase [Pirellulaceae bacterium]